MVLVAYLEYQKSHGEPIRSVISVATARRRDGLNDELVTAWCARELQPDIRNCPDCEGSGWNKKLYLESDGQTVMRCDHAALREAATRA